MKNYEKLLNLIAERDTKIASIEAEYKEKFKEFDCTFSVEKLESLGWKKIGFYAAAIEDIYQKNGKKIGFYREIGRVLVRTLIINHPIHDYEHLEDYANGLVLNDIVFDCCYTLYS